MSGFTFRENDKLEICGELYEVDFGNEELLLKADKKIDGLIKHLTKFEKNKEKNTPLEKALNAIKAMQKEIIEIILGEGSFESLWKKSGQNYNKMTELILHSMLALSEKGEAHIKKYVE